MLKQVIDFKGKFFDIFFPTCCVLCKSKGQKNLDICAACFNDLPHIQHSCPSCGEILPTATTVQVCGSCINIKLPFQQVHVPFIYEEPISQLLLNLKFNQKLLYAKLLGQLMANYIGPRYQEISKPQLIIPVPLHSTRLQERGYNQALELAKPIAHRLKIPIDKYSLIRVKPTAAQSLLPITERHSNIKNAFAVQKPISAQHVAIIDDVMTTGSTVKELAHVLQRSGVKKIDIWCCAKTTTHIS